VSDTTTEKVVKRTPERIYADILEVRRGDLGADPTDLAATAKRAAAEADLWGELAEVTIGRSTVQPWARETLIVTCSATRAHAERLETAANGAK
jgi:hypothetical protein